MKILAAVYAMLSSASTASSWSFEVSLRTECLKSTRNVSILLITSSGIRLLSVLDANYRRISDTICFTYTPAHLLFVIIYSLLLLVSCLKKGYMFSCLLLLPLVALKGPCLLMENVPFKKLRIYRSTTSFVLILLTKLSLPYSLVNFWVSYPTSLGLC